MTDTALDRPISDPRRPARGAALLLAALAALIVLAAGVVSWNLPWAGISLENLGRVEEIEPDSPNLGVLAVGDQVLEVDGTPLPYLTRSLFGQAGVGERVPYTILRSGESEPVTVELRLVEAPWHERVERLSLGMIAVVFLALGVVILLYSPLPRGPILFSAMCSLGAIVISTMELASLRVQWGAMVNQMVLPLSAAAFLQVHLSFDNVDNRPRWHFLILPAYLIGAAIGLTYVSHDVWRLHLRSWYPTFLNGFTLYLLLAFALSAAALVRAWVAGEQSQRRRLRIVAFGTLLSISLLISFVIVAQTTDNAVLFYRFAVWSLILIPIAYAVALHRRDLFALDMTVYRALTYLLLALSLFGTYLVLSWILSRFTNASGGLLFGALTTLYIAFITRPLRGVIEQSLNRYLYGTTYSYREVVRETVDGLGRFSESDLVEVLTRHLPAHLGVERASLLAVARASAHEGAIQVDFLGGSPLSGSAAAIRLGDEESRLVREGRPVMVTADGRWPWETAEVRWIVPLSIEEELQAIWLVGPRANDGAFSPPDRELLATTARTAALVLKGTRLVEERNTQLAASQEAREELSQAYQELARVGEQERRHLARELHDGVLQSLIGFRTLVEQALATSNPARARAMLEEILAASPDLIRAMQATCEGLRPAVLANLGLASGIRVLTQELRERNLEVHQELLIEEEVLNEDQAMHVYRIVQESLNNVIKHAQATIVHLSLRLDGERLTLEVQDDGCGFDPGETEGRRFGMLGLRERALALGGVLKIETGRQRGTRVQVVANWGRRAMESASPGG